MLNNEHAMCFSFLNSEMNNKQKIDRISNSITYSIHIEALSNQHNGIGIICVQCSFAFELPISSERHAHRLQIKYVYTHEIGEK